MAEYLIISPLVREIHLTHQGPFRLFIENRVAAIYQANGGLRIETHAGDSVTQIILSTSSSN